MAAAYLQPRELFGGGWDPDPHTRRLLILVVAIVVGFLIAGIGN